MRTVWMTPLWTARVESFWPGSWPRAP